MPQVLFSFTLIIKTVLPVLCHFSRQHEPSAWPNRYPLMTDGDQLKDKITSRIINQKIPAVRAGLRQRL